MTPIDKLRNVAIIAHVDHGKTTLIDGLLKQSGTVSGHKQMQDRALDVNDLERERGITILSKCTSILYRDHRINIVDTPGHADFGGEVERVLLLVNSVLLLVDAFEGPMPQTRFVLDKALKLGLRPVVVINKVDRENSRPDEVLDLVFDLFVHLGANDQQLDFPVVYASAKYGYALNEIENHEFGAEAREKMNLKPLLDVIVNKVPHPTGDLDKPFRMQVATLDYSDYLGRLAVGRVYDGILKDSGRVTHCRRDGTYTDHKITKMFAFRGLDKIAIDEARAGDIVVLAGIPEVLPGETTCEVGQRDPLPLIDIDEPTISMLFSISDSPFSGQDGKYVTSRQIRERLDRELEQNVSLRVDETASRDSFEVSGRGELHLAILIEQMRREGYELCVGRPKVIVKVVDGQKVEPIEEVILEMDDEYAGRVIDKLNARKGEMQEMSRQGDGLTRLRYLIPTRGLIGFRSEFLTDTRGTGVLHHIFDHYGPFRGLTAGRANGALIAHEAGETTTYALFNLQERGVLFVGAGTPVYSGQIIGLHSRSNDLVVNPCKRKHLTNVRASGSDEALKLSTPMEMTLEGALETIGDDEVVEVTPTSLRVRKRILSHTDRKRAESAART